jgi:hypothetical protein
MQIGLYEFLEKVSKLKTVKEKINALKTNDTKVVRTILQGAFDPSVVWLLPEGRPPFLPNQLVDQETVLIREINNNKLQYFIKGFYDNLNAAKREQMFIQLLEKVDKHDAELLCSIKEKKLPFTGISQQTVLDSFPGMIQENIK